MAARADGLGSERRATLHSELDWLHCEAMAWPQSTMTRPSDVTPSKNGLLLPNELTYVLAPGIGMVGLHHLCARSFRALQFQCWAETGAMEGGIQLTFSSAADAYRTFQVQAWAWNTRYVKSPPWTPSNVRPAGTQNRYKDRAGFRWWLRSGEVDAAWPGQSNHGWGLAFDLARWVERNPGEWDWYRQPIHEGSMLGAWLKMNCPDFGLYWNNPTEFWHLEYCTGDNVPQRVIDVENIIGLP